MNKFVVINPFSEKGIGCVKDVSRDEIARVLSTAKAGEEWAMKSPKERADVVIGLADLIEDNKDFLAEIMANEMGKAVGAGRHECLIASKRVRDFCGIIPRFVEDEKLFESDSEKNIVVFEPKGVALVVSPWNAPVFVSLAGIVPNLLVGNNVIWKPSEYASFSGIKLAELIFKLGLPDGAFQIVVGGKDVGRELVESSDVDIVCLTGSTKAGIEVLKNSADFVRESVLELGGKDAAIVFADVDVERASDEIVKSATMYGGQVCFGVERVYCHEDVYDDFVRKCVEKVGKIKVGNPLNEGTDMGPLVAKFQMDKVLEHIEDAKRKGAKILCGCERVGNVGYFVSPGVIVDVNHDMKIMREETFGPIIPVMKFSDVDEAVRLANDSDYGLTASVWTSDLAKGEEIARRVDAGTVEVNRHGMSKAGCPWGGYKKSGIGRIYSKEGIRELTNVKHVWVVSC